MSGALCKEGSTMRRFIDSKILLCTVLGAAICAATTLFYPAHAETGNDAAASAQGRSEEAISQELDATMTKLQPLLGGAGGLSDKANREKIAAEAIPLARKMVDLLGELKVPNIPQAK